MRLLTALLLLATTGCKASDEVHVALGLTIDSLRLRVADVERRVRDVQARVTVGDEIILDCTKPEFDRLFTNNGTFLVSCQDAVPYLDGYRITLHIGNPSSIEYAGLEVNARWAANILDVIVDDSSTVRRHSYSVNTRLLPGVWNRVQLNVNPATGEEIRNLIVSARTNTVSLRHDYR